MYTGVEWCTLPCAHRLILYFCQVSYSNAFAVIFLDRVILPSCRLMLITLQSDSTLPSRRLMLITLLNDGTLISIGYDNVKPSHYPEKWNLRVGEVVVLRAVPLSVTKTSHPATTC